MVLRDYGLRQDAPDTLGREGELGEGDATVEGFAVMRDQVTAKPETADPLEQNRSPHALREARGVAEPKASITSSAVAYRIKKLPEVVGSSVVEALQHGGDRRPSGMGPEKPVVVDAIRREQHCQSLSVIGLHSIGEGGKQGGEGVKN